MNKNYENELEMNDEVNLDELYESTEVENILLSDEEIDELTMDRLEFYIQKTEVKIDEYELTEVIADEDYEEYLKYKKQEKKLYKKMKELRRPTEVKEKGFFDYSKPWMFIYVILLSVVGMFPVNPFLQYALVQKFDFLYNFVILLENVKVGWGFYFFYIITLIIFVLPGYIAWLCMKKDTNEKRKTRASFLVMQIVITLFTLIGVLIFIYFLN